MQEVAIVYFIVAWLACWLIDLLLVVARGPLLIDPVTKFVIVLVALIIVLIKLTRYRWLW